VLATNIALGYGHSFYSHPRSHITITAATVPLREYVSDDPNLASITPVSDANGVGEYFVRLTQ